MEIGAKKTTEMVKPTSKMAGLAVFLVSPRDLSTELLARGQLDGFEWPQEAELRRKVQDTKEEASGRCAVPAPGRCRRSRPT